MIVLENLLVTMSFIFNWVGFWLILLVPISNLDQFAIFLLADPRGIFSVVLVDLLVIVRFEVQLVCSGG